MRNVKIGVISFLRSLKGWESPTTSQENIQQALEWIDAAGREGCDILCLPEAFNVVGTPAMFGSGVGDPEAILAGAEEIPGPISEAVAERARQHRMYVIEVYLFR